LAVALFAGSSAAEQGRPPPGSIDLDVQSPPSGGARPRIHVPIDPDHSVILIFNHGTTRPQRQHICDEARDVPTVLHDIARANGWTVHYLCSTAMDDGVAGSYTYKRADEILAAVAAFRARGIPAWRIFLLGHSAGGWSSLMAARKDRTGFNAIIAFAPAFAGPRHEESRFPIWRRRLAPEQMNYLLQAKRIDALIFAYEDDEFDRPRDIAPLERIPGIRIIAFDACMRGHGTTYSECFRTGARREIEDYIKLRLAR
jgi:pimeloyl-ACP methyl ester carboxylesterase